MYKEYGKTKFQGIDDEKSLMLNFLEIWLITLSLNLKLKKNIITGHKIYSRDAHNIIKVSDKITQIYD